MLPAQRDACRGGTGHVPNQPDVVLGHSSRSVGWSAGSFSLQETLDEEEATDKALTQLAKIAVNQKLTPLNATMCHYSDQRSYVNLQLIFGNGAVEGLTAAFYAVLQLSIPLRKLSNYIV